MTVFQTLIRRAKTLLWTAFSIVVIFAAVVLGIGKLLIPYSDRYQPRLEAWLSEEFGQPVVLESFAGEWTAFGPRLSLQGMKLLAPGTSGVASVTGAGVSGFGWSSAVRRLRNSAARALYASAAAQRGS